MVYSPGKTLGGTKMCYSVDTWRSREWDSPFYRCLAMRTEFKRSRSSSYAGAHASCSSRNSTRANVPSVMRSFRGQANQQTPNTMLPLLNVELRGTSVLSSSNFTPSGVESTITGVNKPICLLDGSGGCGLKWYGT